MRDYTRMASRKSVSEAETCWLRVLGTLNEYQGRLSVAAKAIELGRGGISRVATLTGMSRPTITKAIGELRGAGPLIPAGAGRIRKAGAGRRRVEVVEPAVQRHLIGLLEETTAGDPMSSLRWTSKSTRGLAAELARRGHPIAWRTVARCLHELGYSLQANRKTREGPQHPDRDAQFQYLNRRVKAFLQTGDPVISVDTKKKELIGAFRNAGRTWRPQGQPHEVFTHDFPHLGRGKAIPYGTYDVAQDRAVVNVGITHDTAVFAVESIRRWWRLMGQRTYPRATRLLISADAGGSNGPRLRVWKGQLQQLTNELGFPITVCHYPPGTSKWNKIEHRLFSFISLAWRGQPLVSYEAVVNLIGSTRTRSGLKVKALLDRHHYELGQTVSPDELKALHVKGHAFHPDWNYTVSPHSVG